MYQYLHWKDFDYKKLKEIPFSRRKGKCGITYNEVIIMADTETSKKANSNHNHVCAWTISLRVYNENLCTLWGQKPTEFCEMLLKLEKYLQGYETYIYFHNLAYDWQFLEKFLIEYFGIPNKFLATKTHYPICIGFECGFIFKDSLILAQRKLEKWAEDLDVEHKKSVGKWDYEKIRNQDDILSADELEYIEHDTLAGVECINRLMLSLNKSIYSMPYTSTGIPREESRKIGKKHKAHDYYLKVLLSYEEYKIFEMVFHGGFTHANRHIVDEVIHNVEAYDFNSSYPYVLVACKYPRGKFMKLEKNVKPAFILRNSENYAFVFKLVIPGKIIIKDDAVSMPPISFSKCLKTVNAYLDNGRLLYSEYLEIYTNEIDLALICEYYSFDKALCVEVLFTDKDYLPRWYTDYVMERYKLKSELNGKDNILYQLEKGKLNSLYGMSAQKVTKPDIIEDYLTGEYFFKEGEDLEEKYNKKTHSYNSILPYQWAIWVTAYAQYNLFQLGKCIDYDAGGIWAYSDTDSCYGTKWDIEKINAYNEECKAKLKANNYGAVTVEGKEFWLGVAEFDGAYSEFKTLGAKKYCCRDKSTNELKLTVSGVPKKKGALCLENDINNFAQGFIFSGTKTGKLTHEYIYVDEIYIDENGNETGNSINLYPCDYKLSKSEFVSYDDLITMTEGILVYDEEI